jgi:hypothetical protein
MGRPGWLAGLVGIITPSRAHTQSPGRPHLIGAVWQPRLREARIQRDVGRCMMYSELNKSSGILAKGFKLPAMGIPHGD